jgi:hypothetical protein
MGVFLMVTALLVLFPVFLQIRAKEHGLRHVWGYILFSVGLFLVGASYAFLAGQARLYVSIAGFAVVLVGLFIQEARGGTERKY